MESGGQLLAERQIEEPRQVEVEDVEHFAAVGAVNPLDPPAAFAAEDVHPPIGKPERSERGEQPHAAGAERLHEAHRHPQHIDVSELIEPGDHIVAQPAHGDAKVETGLRQIAAEEWLRGGENPFVVPLGRSVQPTFSGRQKVGPSYLLQLCANAFAAGGENELAEKIRDDNEVHN